MNSWSLPARRFGLLIAIVLGVDHAATPTQPPPSGGSGKPAAEQRTPAGTEAVASALERLRRTRSFNHPDYPFVVRAQCVREDTLYFVEFLHRQEDGKGFVAVGRAVQMRLEFAVKYEPITLEGKNPFTGKQVEVVLRYFPSIRRETLQVRACQMQWHTKVVHAWFADRFFDLPLPARLREAGFRPYSEAKARISPLQRAELDTGYSICSRILAYGMPLLDCFLHR